MEFRVGTGGWQYFPLDVPDKLVGYSKLFDFVEVNSTFYTRVPLRTVARWREVVPPGFEFTVKCSRELTPALSSGHLLHIRAAIDYLSEVCDALSSNLLVLQTPARLDPSKVPDGGISGLVESLRSRSLRLAWEVRSSPSLRTLSILDSNRIIQVTDLTRSGPDLRDEILYTRLFGLGKHNLYRFASEDLERIEGGARTSGSKKAYFAFHGVAMYADAQRFKKRIAEGHPR